VLGRALPAAELMRKLAAETPDVLRSLAAAASVAP
jgi:hypothetical protein